MRMLYVDIRILDPERNEIVRIGVNIPNDLYRRMEPIKHTINISQVCREAIETYVEDYERARGRLESDHMDEAVDRLFSEEEQLTVDWEDLGWTDARSWVEAVDRETFEYLFHRVDILKKQGRPTWIVPPPDVPGVKTFYERASEYRKFLDQQNERLFDLKQEGNPQADAEQKYGRAWLTYVSAVREKIRQLREDQASAMQKSPKVRSEPGVPEQLMP